ncbi:MAG: hypothetical protein Q7S40_27315, partial [Opitutaceae bacterium]|nr:hypothetical protein [Opitutaceae bacterium]
MWNYLRNTPTRFEMNLQTGDAVSANGRESSTVAASASNPTLSISDCEFRKIGWGREDCASRPFHTTGRAVFRIRRLETGDGHLHAVVGVHGRMNP